MENPEEKIRQGWRKGYKQEKTLNCIKRSEGVDYKSIPSLQKGVYG